MYSVQQKYSVTVLAFMVLLSTISWSFESHYCMGKLFDVTLFTQASDCGMQEALSYFGETENPCCDNEVFVLEGQDELVNT